MGVRKKDGAEGNAGSSGVENGVSLFVADVRRRRFQKNRSGQRTKKRYGTKKRNAKLSRCHPRGYRKNDKCSKEKNSGRWEADCRKGVWRQGNYTRLS